MQVLTAPMQDQAQPASKGLLGLGIWDRLRHRNDDNQPGLFARMQIRIGGWFSHQQQPELGAPIAIGEMSAMRPMSAEPPIDTPANGSAANAGMIPATFSGPPVTSSDADMPASKKFMDRSGHESDYSWITGQIHFVNGNWIIEYASPGTVDQFGGKLILTQVDTRNLRDGDFVNVRGSLLNSSGRSNAAYRVNAISLLERP